MGPRSRLCRAGIVLPRAGVHEQVPLAHCDHGVALFHRRERLHRTRNCDRDRSARLTDARHALCPVRHPALQHAKGQCRRLIIQSGSISPVDLPTDGSLPDGSFNDDHLGTLDAVRGAVRPISKGPNCSRSPSRAGMTAACAFLTLHRDRRRAGIRPFETIAIRSAIDCPRPLAPLRGPPWEWMGRARKRTSVVPEAIVSTSTLRSC